MAQHRSGTGMGKLFMNLLAHHQAHKSKSKPITRPSFDFIFPGARAGLYNELELD